MRHAAAGRASCGPCGGASWRTSLPVLRDLTKGHANGLEQAERQRLSVAGAAGDVAR